jgi:hypothetical protein
MRQCDLLALAPLDGSGPATVYPATVYPATRVSGPATAKCR